MSAIFGAIEFGGSFLWLCMKTVGCALLRVGSGLLGRLLKGRVTLGLKPGCLAQSSALGTGKAPLLGPPRLTTTLHVPPNPRSTPQGAGNSMAEGGQPQANANVWRSARSAKPSPQAGAANCPVPLGRGLAVSPAHPHPTTTSPFSICPEGVKSAAACRGVAVAAPAAADG